MCALDSSHDSGAVSLTCITTGETWECSTSSLEANMLAKPTAPGLWAVVEVGWEARAMRQHDEEQRHLAHEQGLPVRARMEARSESLTPSPQHRDSSK